LQHGSTGGAKDVAGDGPQFDVAIFEYFLDPIALRRVFLRENGSRPGQIPQVSHFSRRNKTASQQAVFI
jgi:hypothetical protein